MVRVRECGVCGANVRARVREGGERKIKNLLTDKNWVRPKKAARCTIHTEASEQRLHGRANTTRRTAAPAAYIFSTARCVVERLSVVVISSY